MRATVPLLLLLVATAGCAPGRSVLTLDVTADPPLSAVDTLEVDVTDATRDSVRSAHASVTIGGASLPPARRVSFVLPAEVSGNVAVAISAHGAGGTLGSASHQVSIHPSEVTDAEISIGGGGAGSVGSACGRPSDCVKPLDSCTVMIDDVTFSGGYCTTVCNSGQAEANCKAAGGDCQDVSGLRICLMRCHPAQGMPCRDGYQCCDGGAPSASGWCAPPTSNVCIVRS
jgi:hypothetical protein